MVFDCGRIGQGLAVLAHLDEVRRALRESGALVLQAPPGTGKTTLIPPTLAEELGGKIIVTSPRRVTARAAAQRLARLHGSDLGKEVGYRVRGDSRPGTVVEFVTPGVLVRQLLADPDLEGVRAIVVDEVHERSLDVDLVVGMALELQQLRGDLALVLMSATVDAQRFAQLISAPVVAMEDPGHPVTVTYRPLKGRAESSREFWVAVAREAARNTHASTHSCLVFVPGMREVRLVTEALTQVTELPVFGVHGSMTPTEQDLALKARQQRIVVSTPVAESSLTIPGVRVVVDGGLARVPRRDQARGLTGLVTLSCPQASAIQRAGRAGREGPGVVVRCYSETEFHHMPSHIAPEIAAADLASFLITVLAWGSTPDQFPLVEQPPTASIAAAKALLRQIGALDTGGAVTALGHRIALVPADPAIAAALLHFGPPAAPIIALLAEERSGDLAAQVASAPAREVQRLSRLAGTAPLGPTPTPGMVVASCFPGRIARKVTADHYLLAAGSRARLAPGHPLRGAQWLACAHITATTHGEPVIHSAVEITQEQAQEVSAPTTRVDITMEGSTVRAVEVTALGAIELARTPVPVTEEIVAQARRAHYARTGFPWSGEAALFAQRLRFANAQLGSPWPALEDIDLSPLLLDAEPSQEQQRQALAAAVPWQHAHELEQLLPPRLVVASGRAVPIDYSQDSPKVSVKLQECFGMVSSPLIAGVPLTFELLSPAGRPVALTADLAGFWAGAYHQVRAEMRGRYSKHPWPEDPFAADVVATAKTKAQSSR